MAQPATHEVHVTSVAGFVLGKEPDTKEERWRRGRRRRMRTERAGCPSPPGYGLEHGAGALLLRREDGSVAATFSAGGSAPAEVARTAQEDRKRNGERPARDRPHGR